MTRAEMIKQLQKSILIFGRRNGKNEFKKLLTQIIDELNKLDQIEHYAWLQSEENKYTDSIRLQMIRDVLTGEDEE